MIDNRNSRRELTADLVLTTLTRPIALVALSIRKTRIDDEGRLSLNESISYDRNDQGETRNVHDEWGTLS